MDGGLSTCKKKKKELCLMAENTSIIIIIKKIIMFDTRSTACRLFGTTSCHSTAVSFLSIVPVIPTAPYLVSLKVRERLQGP